jgi:predicted small secreted protein
MSILGRGLFFLIVAAFGLAACENTIRGAGEDLQETGAAVEDTVEGNP